MISVNIKQKDVSYPIYVSNDEISTLKKSILETVGNNNYVIVTDNLIYKLYSKKLNFNRNKIFILKNGETQKNYRNYLKITEFLLKNKLKREDFIVAIGGGVIGDITGFVASTYMRGINFIQVPTTLLAATDSSVGGKTAINTKYGKNLVGSFYQPKAVFININFLNTLDERQYKSGLGEVIKYGFIEKSCNPGSEPQIINFITSNMDRIMSKDTLILTKLVRMCVLLKVKIIENDEKESGLRRILNYGHTYAHCLETITNYRKYTHGEAVVEGIRFALNIALKLNIIDKEYKFLCEDLINKFGYTPLKSFNKYKILEIMQSDKKSTDNNIRFILPDGYANVCEREFSLKEIERLYE